jgi:hypothetical protein
MFQRTAVQVFFGNAYWLAGAGSSWGERSVAAFAHEYPEVLREVLGIVRERCRAQETEALRQHMQGNQLHFQRLLLHTARQSEHEPIVQDQAVPDGGVRGVDDAGGNAEGSNSGNDKPGVSVSREWLEDGLEKVDQLDGAPGLVGDSGTGGVGESQTASIAVDEVVVVAYHQLPFGHVILACANAGLRKGACLFVTLCVILCAHASHGKEERTGCFSLPSKTERHAVLFAHLSVLFEVPPPTHSRGHTRCMMRC